MSGESYGTLRVLLEDCRGVIDGEPRLGSRQAAAGSILRREWANAALELDRRKTPMNDHVAEVLRSTLAEFVLTPDRYDDLFDAFEFLLAMAAADYDRDRKGWGLRVPLGRFGWKRQSGVPGIPLRSEDISEGWSLLQGGLFGGDTNRARLAHKQVMERWRQSDLTH